MAVYGGPEITTNGLVLYLDAGNTKSYPGSGTLWTDLSENGNNGTLTNGPIYSSSNKGGIVFDGTNDYVTCLYSTSLNNIGGLTNFTIEAFVKWNLIPITGNGQWIIGNVNDTGGQTGGFQLGYIPGFGLNFSTYRTGTGDGINTGTAPANNVWYSMVGLKLVTGYYFYVNGNLVGTTLTSNNGNTSSTPTHIGIRKRDLNSPSTTMYFNGIISSIKVYNRGLSASEILQNYNAFKGRYGL